MTKSMKAAIEETDRRRSRQVEYNIEHGITPKSVVKKITDIMEGARAEADGGRGRGRGASRGLRVAEPTTDYRTLSPDQVASTIRRLETQMYKHAQDLEFEDAARVRDEIHRIREQGLIG